MTETETKSMLVTRTIDELRKNVSEYKKDGEVGLVPTMGYLHDGHLSLIQKSVEDCSHTVVSIFVNPAQFGPDEDFEKYPNDEESDLEMCADRRVDAVFIPELRDIYPGGESIFVGEDRISKILCGIDRPDHFQGVLTVVAILFNIVQPDKAYFGAKDYQQAILIKKMVEELHMPIEVTILPIVREADGIAMSSRNIYLNDDERKQALVLNKSLKYAVELYAAGERNPEVILGAVKELISQNPLVKLIYAELRDAEDLSEIQEIRKPALLAIAARVGSTRLIDNTLLGKEGG